MVFEKYQHWQKELERQPVQFMQEDVYTHLKTARDSLSEFVGCESDDLFFHFSEIQSTGYKIVFPGEFVSMNIVYSDNDKPTCKNIRGVGGLALLTDNEDYHFRVMPKRDNRVSQ